MINNESTPPKSPATGGSGSNRNETRKYTLPNGEIYEGEWKDNKPNGTGKMTLPNGAIYEGEFVSGEVDETKLGKYTFTNGQIYEGEWKDGEANGTGKITTPSGQIYEGEFVSGEVDETKLVKYTFPNGAIYEGEWKDGDFNGTGKFTYLDGEIYEGEWKEGKRNGTGKYTYTDGEIYEGEWKEGKRNGTGKVTSPKGEIYEGEWKDGEANGNFKITATDGSFRKGYYENGGCETLTYYDTDGKKIKGKTTTHYIGNSIQDMLNKQRELKMRKQTMDNLIKPDEKTNKKKRGREEDSTPVKSKEELNAEKIANTPDDKKCECGKVAKCNLPKDTSRTYDNSKFKQKLADFYEKHPLRKEEEKRKAKEAKKVQSPSPNKKQRTKK